MLFFFIKKKNMELKWFSPLGYWMLLEHEHDHWLKWPFINEFIQFNDHLTISYNIIVSELVLLLVYQ